MTVESGQLHDRLAFDAPVQIDDGRHGVQNGFAEDAAAYKCRGRIRYLRGGEAVQAGRLQGTQMIVVTIRNSAEARQIQASWRLRDLRNGREYNITTDPVEADSRDYLEITAKTGVAV